MKAKCRIHLHRSTWLQYHLIARISQAPLSLAHALTRCDDALFVDSFYCPGDSIAMGQPYQRTFCFNSAIELLKRFGWEEDVRNHDRRATQRD